jgi:chemotaxis protein CheX
MTATLFADAHDDLELLVGEVWSSHVAVPDGLLPAPPHTWVTDSGEPCTPCWSGAVSVTGEWHGMIAVDLAEPSARALAQGMLGLDESEDPNALDLNDAVGEMANIVGGNVKSLLPGPNDLSLPLVAHSLLEAPSGLHPQLTLDLAWRDAPVRVRVLALPAATPVASVPEETL